MNESSWFKIYITHCDVNSSCDGPFCGRSNISSISTRKRFPFLLYDERKQKSNCRSSDDVIRVQLWLSGLSRPIFSYRTSVLGRGACLNPYRDKSEPRLSHGWPCRQWGWEVDRFESRFLSLSPLSLPFEAVSTLSGSVGMEEVELGREWAWRESGREGLWFSCDGGDVCSWTWAFAGLTRGKRFYVWFYFIGLIAVLLMCFFFLLFAVFRFMTFIYIHIYVLNIHSDYRWVEWRWDS